jgi:hypothetical protein
MAYAEPNEVYSRGNFDPNEYDNEKVENLIKSAKASIDLHTRNVFEVAADTTRKFDAVDDVEGKSLWFNGKYGLDWCSEIVTVTNGDGTTISASNYVTEPRQGPYYGITLKSAVSWTYNTDDSIDAISIEGKWGYSASPPADIKEACILLFDFLYG